MTKQELTDILKELGYEENVRSGFSSTWEKNRESKSGWTTTDTYQLTSYSGVDKVDINRERILIEDLKREDFLNALLLSNPNKEDVKNIIKRDKRKDTLNDLLND